MTYVAITAGGRYLRLPVGDAATRVQADSPAITPEAIFERVPLTHGRILLSTLDGRFLACRPDSGMGFAVYAQAEVDAAAAFEEVLWPHGEVSLRTCELTYVSAHGDGSVTAGRTLTGAAEKMYFVDVPPSMVPERSVVPAERDPSIPRVSRMPGQVRPTEPVRHSSLLD